MRLLLTLCEEGWCLDDKFVMGKMASECGINIPMTVLGPNASVKDSKEYPIIKPCDPTGKDSKTK